MPVLDETDLQAIAANTRGFAHVYYVSPSGSDGNDGLSVGTAFASLYQAGQTAAFGDLIRLLPGNFSESNPISTSASIKGAGKYLTVVNLGSDPGITLNNAASISELTLLQANGQTTAVQANADLEVNEVKVVAPQLGIHVIGNLQLTASEISIVSDGSESVNLICVRAETYTATIRACLLAANGMGNGAYASAIYANGVMMTVADSSVSAINCSGQNVCVELNNSANVTLSRTLLNSNNGGYGGYTVAVSFDDEGSVLSSFDSIDAGRGGSGTYNLLLPQVDASTIGGQNPSFDSDTGGITAFVVGGDDGFQGVDRNAKGFKNVWYVSPSGNDSNTGKSMAQAFETIGQANNVAGAGDLIRIQAGATYAEYIPGAFPASMESVGNGTAVITDTDTSFGGTCFQCQGSYYCGFAVQSNSGAAGAAASFANAAVLRNLSATIQSNQECVAATFAGWADIADSQFTATAASGGLTVIGATINAGAKIRNSKFVGDGAGHGSGMTSLGLDLESGALDADNVTCEALNTDGESIGLYFGDSSGVRSWLANSRLYADANASQHYDLLLGTDNGSVLDVSGLAANPSTFNGSVLNQVPVIDAAYAPFGNAPAGSLGYAAANLGTPQQSGVAVTLPSAPAGYGGASASDVVAAMLAATVDTVTLSTLLTHLLAAARGSVAVTNNNDGTYLLTFKKSDGATTAFTKTFNPATGVRS